MSDDDTRAARKSQKSWRDDPLSVFLAFAAALLAIMYFLEQRDVAVLEDASAQAKALGATTLDIDGCTVASASTAGRTLVISCDTTSAEAATAAALRAPDLSGFDAVVFVGTDAQLLCGITPSGWPNGCTERPIPSSQ